MKKPSVTELIKLLDKPALLSWANKQGLIGVDITKKRKEWLNYGTSLHNQIYEYITTGTPLIKESDMNNYNFFFKDKEILSVECKVENEYFTGTYDLIYKKNNKIYLSDYKSNAKNIYFENKLQLVAYSMCVDCDALSIISIPDFKEMPFNISDKEPYIEILKSLSIIYKQKQLINGNKF